MAFPFFSLRNGYLKGLPLLSPLGDGYLEGLPLLFPLGDELLELLPQAPRLVLRLNKQFFIENEAPSIDNFVHLSVSLHVCLI